MMPEVKDSVNITYRSIAGDTIVMQRGLKVIATHDLVQLRPTSIDYPYIYITPFGDTVALEHQFRKFEAPIKDTVILTAFDSIKPCVLPPLGDTRLTKEFVQVIPVRDNSVPFDYNNLGNSIVFGVMLFASAYALMKVTLSVIEMSNKIKIILKGDKLV